MSLTPDQPSLTIDGATLDRLPSELRLAFEQIFDEQEQERAKANQKREMDYQGELASALSQLAPWFFELDTDPDYGVAAAYHERMGTSEAGEPAGDATVYRFYRDLYGIEPGFDPVDCSKFDFLYYDFDYDSLGKEPLYEVNDAGDHLVYPAFSSSMPAENFYMPTGQSILVNHRDRRRPFQLYDNYGELMHGISAGESSFLYTGFFWQPTNKKTGEKFLTARRNAMTSIGAFVVDLDRRDDEKGGHFPAHWVMETLVDCLKSNPQIEPNYISLTGTGIQLWYVFGRQIPLLSAKRSPRRDKYGKVLKLLYQWFYDRLPSNRFVVDVPCATICHAFRAPGSEAKLHYPTRMFVNGRFGDDGVSPLALSRFLKGPLKPYDVEDWNEEEYRRLREEMPSGRDAPASEKQLAYLAKLEKMGCIGSVSCDLTIAEADEEIKRGEIVFTRHEQYAGDGFIETSAGHRVRRHLRDPKLYEYTLDRMQCDTPTGSRYNGLFGLAGVAWNCGIPKSRLKRDMESLLETKWAADLSTDGKPLEPKDLRAAMKGYNALGALRPRAMLEARLKWHYAPPQKRNGRTRYDHLWGEWEKPDGTREVNTAKMNRELSHSDGNRGRSIGKLSAFLSECPKASKRKACVELGMSRTTVTKYWAAACAQAGVVDTRTGNHKPF